jgi:regulator of sigma E protease
MTAFQNIAALVVMIGIMILIHELGHYWAARYFDVHVESFSIGFGPRLFGFRRGETDFRISLIPLGGYVKMEGDQPAEGASEDPRAFLNKPRWQRLIVAFAGPFMNLVLSVGLLTGLYMYEFPKPISGGPEGVIDMVAKDSAAAKAGLLPGDRITRIDGQSQPTWEDISLKVLTSPGRAIDVQFERAGQSQTVQLTPETDKRDGIGYAGWREQTQLQVDGFTENSDAKTQGLKPEDVLVSVSGQSIRSVTKLREIAKQSQGKPVRVVYLRKNTRSGQMEENSLMVTPHEGEIDGAKTWLLGIMTGPRVEYVKLSLFDALRQSFDTNVKGAGMIYGALKNIIIARMSPKSLEGPIRIAQASGDAARQGADAFVGLMSAVSLNLALFNLLPIPVLDGGMILLLVVEMLRRRDLPMAAKEHVMRFGFAFLMMLVIFVLYNDIRKTMGG